MAFDIKCKNCGTTVKFDFFVGYKQMGICSKCGLEHDPLELVEEYINSSAEERYKYTQGVKQLGKDDAKKGNRSSIGKNPLHGITMISADVENLPELKGQHVILFEKDSKLKVLPSRVFCDGKFTILNLPDSICELKSGCLQGSHKLKSIIIPKGIKKILPTFGGKVKGPYMEERAFYWTSLKEIFYPKGLKIKTCMVCGGKLSGGKCKSCSCRHIAYKK